MLATLLVLMLQADDQVDFKRDIRPILSNACFQCHGPDDKRRKGDLRLDTKEDAFKSIDGRHAFVAGKPEASEAFRRILTTDADDHMPPAKSGKQLTPKQIELIRKWIQQGAKWSEHWSFVAPERPPVPADKTTLLRRLSLDLVGLPPTPEEMSAFLADSRPDAYERQVERLLASPHYGERWARHWLDAARYADSDGFEKDKPREAWFYRDWVINAFNRDLPYNQFVIEQIAGDLLPNATQDQVVATGFLRNSMINEEGGIDPEQFRMEAMFDRMDAIGRGILGLTIQCAQCHSHKYDPLTHEEYYRMFAFLNNAHETNVTVYTPAETMKRAGILQQIREIEDELRHKTGDWKERMRAWEATVRGDQPAWTVVRPDVDDISTGGQKYIPIEDGSFLAAGYAPTKHTVKLTVKVNLEDITGFRLEQLNDPNLPRHGPGRSIKGTGALSEFGVEAGPADGSAKAQKVKIVSATADAEAAEQPLEEIFADKSNKKRIIGPVAFAIDGKDETAWSVDVGPGRRNQPRKAVFVPEKPVAFKGGAVITFLLKQNHGGWNSDDNQNCNLGRFRLSVTSAPGPTADPLPAAVRAALAAPEEQRSPAQESTIFGYYRTTVAEWKDANDKIEALWRTHPEGSLQLALQERDAMRSTHLLQRGDFLKPEKTVTAGVPSFLNPLASDGPPTRLVFG